MVRLIGSIVFLILWVIIFLPPRVLALLAVVWLSLVLWWYRTRNNRRWMTGAEAATLILTSRKLKTKVVAVEGAFADCYLPRLDTIALSERTFRGTSIGAVSIAAHEAGHALQRKRWFAPWIAQRLLAWPAALSAALCLWIWLVGVILEDQRWLLTAAGCFGVYLLLLLLELVCEIDASRRGVRELTRHGILDAADSRIARRILRSAFLTYVVFFIGSAFALLIFLSGFNWLTILDRLPPEAAEQLRAMLPRR